MSDSRREFFRRAFLGTGVLAGAKTLATQDQDSTMQHDRMSTQHNHHGAGRKIKTYRSKTSESAFASSPQVAVETPDVPDLPFTWDNGVKVFQLIAEPVRREIVSIPEQHCWGPEKDPIQGQGDSKTGQIRSRA